MRKVLPLFVEILGLQSSRGRIMFFVIGSCCIYITPYSVLSGLSLWQRLGIETPSVGLTRAYWHMLHLDFTAAWSRNPLIFAVVAIGLSLLLADVYRLYKQKPSQLFPSL